ncbi:hypothetical protein SLEP1_g40656 [Rubroshorea leprosula]|uniref:Uncharacterized protein n=1 Tax=Rubroshorea leprosula TaxID=152421 RepID=A0AAV5L4K6_9ROSI|nr:hypothetical protein SLEP1_g40656 [Rubroshorea leprosula]
MPGFGGTQHAWEPKRAGFASGVGFVGFASGAGFAGFVSSAGFAGFVSGAGFASGARVWVHVWCWAHVWVRTEPNMPGFGVTQHAWVRFLANPTPGFAFGFLQTQHAWVHKEPRCQNVLTGHRFPRQVTGHVPNVIGFALGSAQLVLYAIYKKRSASAKSTRDSMEEEEEEEGSAQLVKKGNIEMSSLNEDEEANLKNWTLNKGKCLTKLRGHQQKSLQKMEKTLSLGPYDLRHYSSNFRREIDAEKGNCDHL